MYECMPRFSCIMIKHMESIGDACHSGTLKIGAPESASFSLRDVPDIFTSGCGGYS